MKAGKKDNPYVVAGLCLVLVSAIGLTVLQMSGGGGTDVVTLKHGAAQSQRSAPAVSAPDISHADEALPRSWRDPFSSPALARKLGATVSNEIEQQPGIPRIDVARPGQAPRLSAIPIGFGPPAPQRAKLPDFVRPLPAARRDSPVGAAAQQDRSPEPALRLTAIIGDGQRSALIEREGGGSIVVRVGDRIGEFRVAAVNEAEVVLASDRSLLTLPLMSSSGPASRPKDAAGAEAKPPAPAGSGKDRNETG